MQYDIFLGIALTFGAGMLAQWVAWRFRLPAIVLLFTMGLLFGPGLGILHPSETMGWVFRPLVSLLVAIVVFEGGMALDIRQLREAGEGVARLTMLALPINWVLGSLAAHYVAHLEWGTAMLFGAIIVVTGPTVVLPLLRSAKLQPRVAAFLRWEAIVNDPLGAILAAVVLQLMLLHVDLHTGVFFTHTLPDLLAAATESISAGILPAYLIRYLFTRDMMPEILKTPVLISMALVIFTACNLEMEGAGLVAVTIFGMALTNLHIPGVAELRRIKESMVVLVVSVLFILLTADLHREVLKHLSIPILMLTLVVLFVVRPVGIFFSTLGTSMPWKERLFVGWIAPRGIVAAAVAGAAGIRLKETGYQSADLIMPAVFAVIAVTMILHGFSLRPIARALKLTLSNDPAIAILGASGWSVDLAACLHREGIPVLLVDNRSSALMPAAQMDIPVLRTELLSQHGQEALEERPADYLIATTGDGIYNGMICGHLAPAMGRERVFQISPGVARLDFYHGLSRDSRGKVLGEPAWNYTLFDTLFEQGWRFTSRVATEANAHSFGTDDNRLDILVSRRTALLIRSAEDSTTVVPMPGDLMISMVPPTDQTGTEREAP
ncbi:Na+/H+ antiporter [Gluconobacter thailandicus F149-1 = NBRC 100600]|uniref:Na+/H+ antiporter n=1 Tax=Gluconobacter thailandicus NBRC 3257 TaxID=1381097 RepID=A0ABQ0J0A0_GLUTH|nr:sodium:proton antiporter [Gluconobacter thailandicus]KXV52938.1 sodium:proton antiporter [Gluconobacter thailandicus]GAC86700.1 Na+/H+ antiporter [Gluconobacter thailandicus NBRC 3255]GAD27886.1 Na+/H+ antiporter [Gluconobacter thailandicus NBRC 3257]GAN93266.1 Na+/H+ antiporter [Gluconobacter thailandicus F149-1 = NBRC 100600]GBR59641.1 Na+/H+ antiporter [Gluconobacter thailandicus F149-1 = NBRC 100600]